MPSWVKALTLNARQFRVCVLATCELTSLINISSEVRPIPPKRHKKRGHTQNDIANKHYSYHDFLVQPDPKHTHQQPKIENVPCKVSQISGWSFLHPWVMVPKVRSVPVKHAVVVIVLLLKGVDHSAPERVMARVVLLAPLLVRVVHRDRMEERRY